MPLTATESHSSPGAQQVLDAARALFGEQGVDAVSIQDIATKAGVSKANVFHHFANKEALYLAVIRACVGTPSADIAALIASDQSFEQRLLTLMQSQLKDMLDDASSTRLVIREMTNGNAERTKLLATQIFTDKIKARVQFFEDAQQRGELRADVPPHFCDMLLSACCLFHFNCGEASKHISEDLGMPLPYSADEFARVVCNVLTHGLDASVPNQGLGLPAASSPTPAAVRRRKPAATPKPTRRQPSPKP